MTGKTVPEVVHADDLTSMLARRGARVANPADMTRRRARGPQPIQYDPDLAAILWGAYQAGEPIEESHPTAEAALVLVIELERAQRHLSRTRRDIRLHVRWFKPGSGELIWSYSSENHKQKQLRSGVVEAHAGEEVRVVYWMSDPGEGLRSPAARTARRRGAGVQRSKDIRTWAKGQGLEVPDRGKVPGRIAEQYDKRELDWDTDDATLARQALALGTHPGILETAGRQAAAELLRRLLQADPDVQESQSPQIQDALTRRSGNG